MNIGDHWRRLIGGERKKQVAEAKAAYLANPKFVTPGDFSAEWRRLDAEINKIDTKLRIAIGEEKPPLNAELEKLQIQKEGCGEAMSEKTKQAGVRDGQQYWR